jgi:nucleoside-diphosphate-sugar epimerase
VPDGPERALVTGASGFIGSRVLERLRKAGLELHALSRTHEPGEEEGVRWWRGDVGDREAVARTFASVRPDLVFNLAGETRAARGLELVVPTFESNLVGTVNVLHAAAEAGSARVVLSGSLEEPDDATPSSPYAASKWAAGVYGRMFECLYGLSIVNLRLFMVYGPGQLDLRKLVPYTTLALLRGMPPEVSSGSRQIDWVYVDDVADAFLSAGSAAGLDGRTLDIGSGTLCSVREIVDRLTQLVAPEIEPVFGALEDRPFEQVRVADAATTATSLGWRPATSLEEGLSRTVDWYRERLAEGTFAD